MGWKLKVRATHLWIYCIYKNGNVTDLVLIYEYEFLVYMKIYKKYSVCNLVIRGWLCQNRDTGAWSDRQWNVLEKGMRRPQCSEEEKQERRSGKKTRSEQIF